MHVREIDDADLIVQARHDPEAFDALYRHYVTPVYRYCYARTGTAVEAEDLTAQVFLAVLESLDSYRKESAFAAWLFGIAYRKCADYYRSKYASRDVALEAAAAKPDGGAEDPEEAAWHSDVLDCVEVTLPHLSPERTQAVHLRYWGGLRMREIARVMQKSEAAVKMLISRAIADLRERCWNE